MLNNRPIRPRPAAVGFQFRFRLVSGTKSTSDRKRPMFTKNGSSIFRHIHNTPKDIFIPVDTTAAVGGAISRCEICCLLYFLYQVHRCFASITYMSKNLRACVLDYMNTYYQVPGILSHCPFSQTLLNRTYFRLFDNRIAMELISPWKNGKSCVQQQVVAGLYLVRRGEHMYI